MDFKDITEFCQAQALADKLHPTDDSVWRRFCRKYARLFYTPLHVVETMEPAKVVLAVMEDQLDDVDVDENMEVIMDIIYGLEDPEYAKVKRDELKSFIKEAEAEEEARQESGKPIHKLLKEEDSVSTKPSPKKTLLKDTPTPEQNLPQGGGLNLSYLENLDKDEDNGEF